MANDKQKKISYGSIAGVALIVDGEVQSLPKPNRHPDLLAKFPGPKYHHTMNDQGFVDHYGNFLNREEAMVRAKALGQVSEDHSAKHLHSEDLW